MADPLAVRKGTVVAIPALACGAAIAVLFAATFTRVAHAATMLAAAALLLVMLRAYSELRLEIAARERTEKSLRVSEAGYRRVADEQAALRRVATLVARGARPSEVFAAVTDEVGGVLGTEVTWLRRYLPGPAAAAMAAFAAGQRLPPEQPRPLGGLNITTLVHQTGQPARVQDPDWPLRDGKGQVLPVTSGVGVPVVVEGSLWGVMAVGSSAQTPLPPGTEARLAAFTELIAMAIANAQAHDELSASRARVVASADETRRRIERDLHDGAQQQFVSLALKLRAVQASVPPGQATLANELGRVAAGLADALDDLRELSRGIHPAILTEAGLEPALRALARRSPIPVRLDVRTEDRLPERAEVTAYYIISEALANTAKHANATAVRVEVDATPSAVRLAIRDDGAGGADPARGTGLLGLYDRVEAAGGTLTLHSPPGKGTQLLAEFPCNPRQHQTECSSTPRGTAGSGRGLST